MGLRNKMASWVSAFFENKNGAKIALTGNNIYTDSENIAFKELAIYSAISIISSAVSKCEIKVFINNEVSKDEEYYKLNISPNNNQTSSAFWHQAVESMLIDGECLVIINDKKFYVADTYYREEKSLYDDIFTNVTIKDFTFNKTFYAKDVLFFKLENEEVKRIIDELYISYGKVISTSIDGYLNSLFHKFKLKISTTKAGDPKFLDQYNDMTNEKLTKFMKPGNSVIPEYEGFSLDPMKLDHTQSGTGDIRDMRKDIMSAVGQAYKIPLSLMFGEVSNVDEVTDSLISFAVEPVVNVIEEELTRKRVPFLQWRDNNCYYEVDTQKIKYMNIFKLAANIEKIICNGVYCIDEVRVKLGDRPLNTDFSKTHFMTKNSSDIQSMIDEMMNDVSTAKGGG